MDAVRGTRLRVSPTRSRLRSRALSPDGKVLTFRLPFRPPYDWTGLVRFLGERAIPGVEAIDAHTYRRTIEIEGRPGTIEVKWPVGRTHLLLRVRAPVVPSGRVDLVARVRRLFDLDADPLAIAQHLAADRRLGVALAMHPGIRVPGAWDGFELAVRAILGQQVTVKGATTLCGRLAKAFGKPIAGLFGLTHLFPTPETVAAADVTRIGVPRSRGEAIRALARAVASGRLSLKPASSLGEAIARLTAMPGIGDWTANYIAMRALGETDALPASDLGVRRALGRGRPLTPMAVKRLANAWRPWRAYAVMHLWNSLKKE